MVSFFIIKRERERKIGYIGLIALKMVGKVLLGSMGVITSV